VGVSFGIYKIVGCRKKNVGVQEETAPVIIMSSNKLNAKQNY